MDVYHFKSMEKRVQYELVFGVNFFGILFQVIIKMFGISLQRLLEFAEFN